MGSICQHQLGKGHPKKETFSLAVVVLFNDGLIIVCSTFKFREVGTLQGLNVVQCLKEAPYILRPSVTVLTGCQVVKELPDNGCTPSDAVSCLCQCYSLIYCDIVFVGGCVCVLFGAHRSLFMFSHVIKPRLTERITWVRTGSCFKNTQKAKLMFYIIKSH